MNQCQNLITIQQNRFQKIYQEYNKKKMNKLVYLGLSILEISKTLKYEFWYDYIKPKYQNNAKICYMDTGSFIIHIKTEGFYKDIADGVKKVYYTSNCEID